MPQPDSFKGDEGTPNFRAIGTLSPAVNRKVEPFGAAFLAHARRQRHGRTFSEDDRIQALAKVKKTEDDEDGEISEPEDPMMLQRDAKDWKVYRARTLNRTSINIFNRDKITMLFSVSLSTATALLPSKSRKPTARRS